MKGFNWAGDLNGHKTPIVRKMYIPTATAIEKGEPINYTPGTGVVVLAGPTDFDDPIDGVSMQEHAANSGTELEVSVSPTSIYKYKAAKTYTMTGGSTTTAVDSSLVPQTDNFWIGGSIKIIACAADSSLNGRIVKISDSTGATGTLTLAETLPAALASGDTYQLCPGYMAEGYLGYDLDSDAMNPDYDAIGGNVLRILYSNPDTMETYFVFERHANVS
jgi:hypothetical protein